MKRLTAVVALALACCVFSAASFAQDKATTEKKQTTTVAKAKDASKCSMASGSKNASCCMTAKDAKQDAKKDCSGCCAKKAEANTQKGDKQQ